MKRVSKGRGAAKASPGKFAPRDLLAELRALEAKFTKADVSPVNQPALAAPTFAVWCGLSAIVRVLDSWETANAAGLSTRLTYRPADGGGRGHLGVWIGPAEEAP